MYVQREISCIDIEIMTWIDIYIRRKSIVAVNDKGPYQ